MSTTSFTVYDDHYYVDTTEMDWEHELYEWAHNHKFPLSLIVDRRQTKGTLWCRALDNSVIAHPADRIKIFRSTYGDSPYQLFKA